MALQATFINKERGKMRLKEFMCVAHDSCIISVAETCEIDATGRFPSIPVEKEVFGSSNKEKLKQYENAVVTGVSVYNEWVLQVNVEEAG